MKHRVKPSQSYGVTGIILGTLLLVGCASVAENSGSPDFEELDTSTFTRVTDAAGNSLWGMKTGSPSLVKILRGSGGTIYTHNSEEILRYESAQWTAVQLKESRPNIQAICERPDGMFWVITWHRKIFRGPLDNLEEVFEIPARQLDGLTFDAAVSQIHCESDGSVTLSGSYNFVPEDASPVLRTMLARFDGTSLTDYALEYTARVIKLWSHDDAILAAGTGGTLLLRRNGNVTTIPTGTTADIVAFAGQSLSNFYLGASDGTVLHFDGNHFTSIPLPRPGEFPVQINDIAITPGEVLISVSAPTEENSSSLAMHVVLSLKNSTVTELADQPEGMIAAMLPVADGVLAVGSREGARIAKYDGIRWQDEYHRPSLGVPNEAAINAGGKIVAVGQRAVSAFNGQKWQRINSDDFRYTDVVPFDEQRFLISLNNHDSVVFPLMLSDGSTVFPIAEYSNTDAHLQRLATCGDGTIWAAGYTGDPYESAKPSHPLAVHFDGNVWTEHILPDDDAAFYSVGCTADMAVMSTGDVLMQYKNGNWSQLSGIAYDEIDSVFVGNANAVYLGRMPISVWNGATLTPIDTLLGIRAFDMAATDSGALLVAGDFGLENTDGKNGVLMMLTNGESHVLIENDELFFSSVFVTGNQMVALDTGHIWWGEL